MVVVAMVAVAMVDPDHTNEKRKKSNKKTHATKPAQTRRPPTLASLFFLSLSLYTRSTCGTIAAAVGLACYDDMYAQG
jgi:amino acid permease